MAKIHNIITNVAPSAAPDSVGQHWTNTATGISYISVGTSGVGDWKDVTTPSGGGGIDPSYIDATLAYTDTQSVSHDQWKDVNGASITITPTGTEKWELAFDCIFGSLTANLPNSNLKAYARIVDSANNLIDSTEAYYSRNQDPIPVDLFPMFWPMKLNARATVSAPTTYKVQIKQQNGASLAGTNHIAFAGAPSKFFAKRVY